MLFHVGMCTRNIFTPFCKPIHQFFNEEVRYFAVNVRDFRREEYQRALKRLSLQSSVFIINTTGYIKIPVCNMKLKNNWKWTTLEARHIKLTKGRSRSFLKNTRDRLMDWRCRDKLGCFLTRYIAMYILNHSYRHYNH